MSEGFMITDITGDKRKNIAMIVLQRRLQWAVERSITDATALGNARAWAGENFRTSKQALAWVDKQVDEYNKRADATYRAYQYLNQLTLESEEVQTSALLELITHAFLTGWSPETAPQSADTPAG